MYDAFERKGIRYLKIQKYDIYELDTAIKKSQVHQ